MRIGIDVRYLSHGLMGGVHTYVRHLVPALIALTEADQLFLYADDKQPFELADLPPRITVRCLPWRHAVSSIFHDLWGLRRVMARDRLEVVHFPANYGFGPAGVPTVITLHDEINVMPWREIVRGHAKRPRTVAMMAYLHLCSSAAVRQARVILTDSEYSRKRIARYARLPVDRITSVHLAPGPDVRRITDPAALTTVRQRYGLDSPFVLADALKNPAVLIRAWRLLPEAVRQSRQIVFFARRANLSPIVQEAIKDESARLVVRPSREELMALYSQAEVFAFPSWIEGFGLPVLEAMTCGAPVVASDRGSIPEVAGGAALTSDAEDAVALSAHLERLLTFPLEAAQWRERGYARAAQFSWERVARETLQVYRLARMG